MRRMLRIALGEEADGLAQRRRRRGCPAAILPTVRPPFSTSNGTSYPKSTRKISDAAPRARTTPGADVNAMPTRECEDDRDLDHRVEEAGDEAGTDTGEHELERDALRRRDRHAVVEEHVTNLDEFVRERTPTWTELEQLVARGGNSPARLGPDGVLRLGCVLPRGRGRPRVRAPPRFPSDPIVGRLERLTQRGRHAVYNTHGLAQHGARVRRRAATGGACASGPRCS